MKNLKIEIQQHCLELVREKVDTVLSAIKAQQEAANNETKSSAGDKFETGRAMAHFEQEKLASQLETNTRLENILSSIDASLKCTKIEAGSLVKTNTGLFYISVAIGKVTVNHQDMFIISPSAPISQKMLGLRAGNTFQFNGKIIEILSIV